MTDTSFRIDPMLVASWLRARSRSRNLPQPVADHGGLRVDTASETERARYVFAAPVDGLRQLANEIDQPRVFIKLCGSAEDLRALLPERWMVQTATCMMTRTEPVALAQTVPDGFRVEVETADDRRSVRILTEDGGLAASGFAAEFDGVFAYDRILVEAPFRRMGLGRTLMAALGATRRSPASTEILAATEQGRALYSTLGWRVYSPYTTAVIPD